MSTVATTLDWRDWLARSRGWLGIGTLVPFGLVALFSHPLYREGTWGDMGFDTLAWIVFFVGATFRWWATLYIGGRKATRLASDGPYSICRNPLYFGTFCLGLSVAIFLESLTFVAGFFLVGLIYLTITVPAEERLLHATLGAEYDEYLRRVPRFFPRFSLLRTPPTIEVSVRGLMAESVRAARWIWIPVLCEMINQLRTEAWWPQKFFLP